MIKYLSEMQRPRLRVRRLDVDRVVERALAAAQARQKTVAVADHGGSVANKYGYPAETECALVVADPLGNAVVFCGRKPANKVTLSGVASELCPELVAYFDERYSQETRALIDLESILRRHFSPLELLASA